MTENDFFVAIMSATKHYFKSRASDRNITFIFDLEEKTLRKGQEK